MAARAGTLRTSGSARRVETAVRQVAAGRRLVLAVSGGRDSMTLLHAAAAVAPESVVGVAAYDHGTGPAATRAVALVASTATQLGFEVFLGRAAEPGTTEAEWRHARGEFLAQVATRTGGTVATGHTRDDHVETVLMRVLRDAGARGLAGLYADTGVVRPLLDCSRTDVAAYARDHRIAWIDDPSNESLEFLRNRVRHDLLPALANAVREFESDLLWLSRRASQWRSEVAAIAETMGTADRARSRYSISSADLVGFTPEQLAVLWPALAARVGLVMDRRGTRRAAAFTGDSRPGARVQISGGWELKRTHGGFELSREPAAAQPYASHRLIPELQLGVWRFSTPQNGHTESIDPWIAQLPANAELSVRPWRPGDRMQLGPGRWRRVKRFLSDAHVSGARRGEWPVVLAGDEIIWIPGVRRSDAAAVRPGRPGVLYRCDLDDSAS
jgi:tRNA(Ile)-lysidine synthase